MAYLDSQKVVALDKLSGKHDAYFYRYLWVSSDPKLRDDFISVLYYHCHLLSDQGAYGTFTMVKPDLIRIDMRDYGWDQSNKLGVWEQAQKIDPYFHAPIKFLEDSKDTVYWPGGVDPTDGKEYEKGAWPTQRKVGDKAFTAAPNLPKEAIDGLRETLYTESPILMAEWFFVQTARQVSIRNAETGFAYYDFTGIKDRDSYFKLLGVDEKAATRLFRELRAVVEKSGISQQNRQVVALGATSGKVWGTLDVFDESAKGVAKENLRRGEFAHDAEEWYGHNPLGLPLTALFDKNGKTQATAPDKIGPDDSALNTARDHRVHVNLCMRCHGVGKDHLMPIDDWARKTFKAGGRLKLQDPDKKVTQELQAQYLRDIQSEIDEDRRVYSRAVAAVTVNKKNPKGMTVAAITKLYAEAFHRYVDDGVSLEDAAREYGVKSAEWLKGLERYQITKGRTENAFTNFVSDPPTRMKRIHFENSYQLGATIAAGLSPAELPQKRKARP